MHYLALACDYDGTWHGLQAASSRICCECFRAAICSEWVVAKNGCLLYRPATQEQLPLHEPMSNKFIETLQARGVPLTVGKVIYATWMPHEGAVLEAIRECGLELQVIFNKGAVMILPPGHNKASGLAAALDKMGLSRHNVVAIADAENDHAFLELCGCAVAVANALPMMKEKADFVTRGEGGDG